MFKKISLLCLSMLIGVLCLSNTSNNDAEEASYVEDGLVYEKDELEAENKQLLKYKEELKDYVHVINNQIVVDYDSIKKTSKFDGDIDKIKEEAEFANSLAEERPDIVTINQDTSLSFNIEDEYAEQWDAWYISWSLWDGWTWKLDSDFGKLAGIAGIVYAVIDLVFNASLFYNKLLKFTEQSEIEKWFEAIVLAALPTVTIKNVIKNYLKNNIGLIISGLITINLWLMAWETASLGFGWVALRFINFIVGRLVPNAFTACSLIYNCFKYNKPIYFRFWFTTGCKYSLEKF